jgi:hypothetical protein
MISTELSPNQKYILKQLQEGHTAKKVSPWGFFLDGQARKKSKIGYATLRGLQKRGLVNGATPGEFKITAEGRGYKIDR